MWAALVSLAVGLAPLGAAVEPRSVPVPEDAFGAEVSGGALFYSDDRSRVVRFDLATGQSTVGYATRDRKASITGLQAGGGRLAVEISWGLRRRTILALDLLTGERTRIGSGRVSRRRGCGRAVKLDHVSQAGDILVSSATVRCHRRRGTLLVRAFRGVGPPLTLLRRPTTAAIVSDGVPYRSLEGSHFLTWGDRHGRVRDLESGRVRPFGVDGNGRGVGEVEVDTRGRLLVHEYTLRGLRLRQLVRLGNRVVFRSPDIRKRSAEARFCGGRAVVHVLGRRYERLSLLDPPVVLREGVPSAPDFTATCDADQYVVLNAEEPRALVYDLPR
jgi:hypothetical protein